MSLCAAVPSQIATSASISCRNWLQSEGIDDNDRFYLFIFVSFIYLFRFIIIYYSLCYLVLLVALAASLLSVSRLRGGEGGVGGTMGLGGALRRTVAAVAVWS